MPRRYRASKRRESDLTWEQQSDFLLGGCGRTFGEFRNDESDTWPSHAYRRQAWKAMKEVLGVDEARERAPIAFRDYETPSGIARREAIEAGRITTKDGVFVVETSNGALMPF